MAGPAPRAIMPGLLLIAALGYFGVSLLLDVDWRDLLSRLDGSDKPVLLERFGEISAYKAGGGKLRTCYLFAPPTSSGPSASRRLPDLQAGYRPGDRSNKAWVAASFDQPLDKTVRADLTAGGIQFKLEPVDTAAYSPDDKVATAILAAFRREGVISAAARAADGTVLTDIYVLGDIGRALDRIAGECGIEIPIPPPSAVDFGETPVSLGSFGQFEVQGAGRGIRRRCTTTARPLRDDHLRQGRADAALILVDSPATGQEGDMAFVFGRRLGQDARVSVWLNKSLSYAFGYEDDRAWVRPDAASSLRRHLRDEHGFSVSVRLADGTEFSDFYAGDGYAAARAAAMRACG